MFKIFYVKPDGMVCGAIQPTILKFETRTEAEMIAERYRKAHGGKHQYAVYFTDAEGRIVKETRT